MTVLNDPRDAFDAALIPGMRQRLAEGYARFRAAEAKAVAQLATPEAGGVKGAYRDRHCPNCGAAAPAQTLLRAHGIDLVSCPDCDLTYSRQVMDEAADAERYRASDLDIEAMQLRCSGPYLELETARARYYLDRLGETMTRTGTMCEIGCGTGVFWPKRRSGGGMPSGSSQVQPLPRSRGDAPGRSSRAIFRKISRTAATVSMRSQCSTYSNISPIPTVFCGSSGTISPLEDGCLSRFPIGIACWFSWKAPAAPWSAQGTGAISRHAACPI